MKRIPWDEAEPGHFEVDLVHHCGPSPSGEYVHTLQTVDVTTGWSERVAVLGRSFRVMRAGFQRCLERLPFPVLEVHPDNGSEFFNHHLVRSFRDAVQGVELSRFFQPVMRLTEKTVIPVAGRSARIKRRYDQAQTPFDRLSTTNAISVQDRRKRQAVRNQINPRQLRREIYDLLDYLFTLPCATPGSTEDVYQTLVLPLSLPKGEDTLVTFSFE
jgi:hypothetical protein